MAAFKMGEDSTLDWQILQDGGISVYRKRAYLEEDVESLKATGYRVILFDCGLWSDEMTMHEDLASKLSFPSYYGRNLNALNDCLLGELNVPDEGGAALIFNRFDSFVRAQGKRLPETVLHILARASRHMLLTGRRLLTLIQSDDPKLNFEGLGAVTTQWNRREWLNKNRGL